MSNLRTFISFAVTLFALASCTGNKERVEHIPDKAAGVGVIDLERITSKAITWEELFSMKSVKRLLRDEDQSNFQKLIKSGVDLNNKIYVFGVPEQEEQNSYGSLIFAVDDPKVIENSLKEENENWQFKDGEEGIRIGKLEGNSNSVMGLSDRTGIMVFSENGEIDEGYVNKLYNLESNEALINTASNFKELAGKEADIMAWTNNNKVGEILSDFSPTNILGGSSLTTSKTTFVSNFEKGKMTMDTKVISNTDSIGPYQRMYQGEINQDIIKNLNSESPLFLTSMAFDMEEVMKILKKEALLKQGNSMLKRQMPGDFTAKDVVQSLRGDVAGSFNALTNKKVKKYNQYTEDTMEMERKMGHFQALLGLKKPDMAENMLKKLSEKFRKLKKTEEGKYKMDPYVRFSVRNNILAIEGPANQSKQMANNSEKQLPDDLKKMMKNNALLYHLNFDALGSNIKQLLMNFLPNSEAIDKFPVESVTQTTNNDLSETTKSHTKISFKNKEQNCLVTLKEYLSGLSESSEAM